MKTVKLIRDNSPRSHIGLFAKVNEWNSAIYSSIATSIYLLFPETGPLKSTRIRSIGLVAFIYRQDSKGVIIGVVSVRG